MIILWWLFMASRFSFHYVAQYSDGAKENWYQGVRTFALEVTSNAATNKKNEQKYVRLQCRRGPWY